MNLLLEQSVASWKTTNALTDGFPKLKFLQDYLPMVVRNVALREGLLLRGFLIAAYVCYELISRNFLLRSYMQVNCQLLIDWTSLYTEIDKNGQLVTVCSFKNRVLSSQPSPPYKRLSCIEQEAWTIGKRVNRQPSDETSPPCLIYELGIVW